MVRRNQPSGDHPIYVSKDFWWDKFRHPKKKIGGIRERNNGLVGDPVTTQPSPHGWTATAAAAAGVKNAIGDAQIAALKTRPATDGFI